MSNPTQINDEVLSLMSDTRIWHSQRDFKGLTRDMFIELMKTKYNYLHTNSSTLFDRCIAGDLNIEQFNYMINMLKKINEGKDYQQASTEVGQKLVDIYVSPLLNDKK
jgi:hypothetical protein